MLVLPVFVMELLRPVYGDTHQPVVLLEEPAPFIGQQRAVDVYKRQELHGGEWKEMPIVF